MWMELILNAKLFITGTQSSSNNNPPCSNRQCRGTDEAINLSTTKQAISLVTVDKRHKEANQPLVPETSMGRGGMV